MNWYCCCGGDCCCCRCCRCCCCCCCFQLWISVFVLATHVLKKDVLGGRIFCCCHLGYDCCYLCHDYYYQRKVCWTWHSFSPPPPPSLSLPVCIYMIYDDDDIYIYMIGVEYVMVPHTQERDSNPRARLVNKRAREARQRDARCGWVVHTLLYQWIGCPGRGSSSVAR